MKMKRLKIICLVIVINVLMIIPAFAADCIICLGASPLERYAAKELKEYIGILTRENFAIANTLPQKKSGKYFILKSVSTNAGDNKQIEKQASALEGKGPDAFVIKSDHMRLHIVGNSPRAVLYGVYHYLEFVCGVGFFVDGEYIPKLKELPFENINILQQPRFKLRLWNSDFGHHSLWKYQSAFWGEQQWEKQISWMNKRKLNLTNLVNLYKYRDLGLIQIYHPSTKKLSELERYVSERDKAALKLCRKFEIDNIYWVNFGDVDKEFVQNHPEIKFSKPDAYGQIFIDPDDPQGEEYTKKFLSTLINIYGTDHYYCYTPYCEFSPGATEEESIYLKTQAARKFYKTLKEVDPKATWVLDTWDFVNRKLWTQERLKKFLQTFINLDLFIYDTQAEIASNASFDRHDGFYGTQWAFGVLNSFATDDESHGAIDIALKRLNAAANTYNNCLGFFLVPELTNSNVFYWHLMSLLAWSPEGWDVNSYTSWFCQHRYGKTSAMAMEAVWKKVVEAIYQQEGYFHRARYKHQSRILNLETSEKDLRENARRALGLRNALTRALEIEREQKRNPLYENDMVTLARNYLGYCFNYNFVAANRAFTEGDSESFDIHRAICMKILNDLELILSTRKDYSLKVMIDELQSLSGSDQVSRIVREGSIIYHDYTSNDVYEQFGLYYIPKMQKYFEILRGRIKSGNTTFPKQEMDKIVKETRENWLENELDLSRCARFKGSTMQAIKKAIRNAQSITFE